MVQASMLMMDSIRMAPSCCCSAVWMIEILLMRWGQEQATLSLNATGQQRMWWGGRAGEAKHTHCK